MTLYNFYPFIPELLLVLSTLGVFSITIFQKHATQKQTNISRTTLIVGIIASTIVLAIQSYELVTISVIFKLYFVIASLFFIMIYSKKFPIAECLSILGLTLGAFLIFSFNSSIIIFCSMVLFTASIYCFILTRERLIFDESIFLTSSVLMLLLIYKASPLISLTSLIILSLAVLIKTKNKDIEALIMFFVIPMICYLLIICLGSSEKNNLCLVLKVLSFGILIFAVLLKRHTKYGLFYIGNILLFISMGTKDSVSLSIILMALIPFVYSQHLTPLSILNLGIFPISPSFIAKYIFASILIKAGAWTESLILLGTSLAFWIFGAKDLANNFETWNSNRLQPNTRPWILTSVSLLAIVVTAIFFNSFQNVLKISMDAILRTI